jgi:tRNA-Thr(GGU) m(6)t(6)A37 methyltransferase TsaA
VIDTSGHLRLEPIGFFRSTTRHKNEAPRQGTAAPSAREDGIELCEGFDLETAVRDLAGFERVWLIYGFHLASGWKPLVQPPRGPHVKRGVLATRSPHRPNPLGLTCARLLAVDGRRLRVAEADLLDGSPIYDLKPYLPYADAFPNAKAGWAEELERDRVQVDFSEEALRRLAFVEALGVESLRDFLLNQLSFDPIDAKRKRVVGPKNDGVATIAYRTWRAAFRVQTDSDGAITSALVETIFSGYSELEMSESSDRYGDKMVHRAFRAAFAVPQT